jgi:hypothetical protein
MQPLLKLSRRGLLQLGAMSAAIVPLSHARAEDVGTERDAGELSVAGWRRSCIPYRGYLASDAERVAERNEHLADAVTDPRMLPLYKKMRETFDKACREVIPAPVSRVAVASFSDPALFPNAPPPPSPRRSPPY